MPEDLMLLEGPEEESRWGGQWMGGGPGEPGWVPPEEEPQWIEGQWEDVTPPSSPGVSDKARREREKRAAKVLKEREEFTEEQRKTSLEELKAKRRQYRREHRPQVGKWVRTYLKPRPQPEMAKIFFPGRALRETYIPRAPVKTTTEQIRELQRTVKPEMGLESSLGRSVITSSSGLRRASNPPPNPVIKAPARNPEEFEGLGPALVRLRKIGELKKVDQAVLAEVKANGDIDTPNHVISKVGLQGFSPREVDSSLKRLRNLGFIVPTGRVYRGEKELMLSGGSHG